MYFGAGKCRKLGRKTQYHEVCQSPWSSQEIRFWGCLVYNSYKVDGQEHEEYFSNIFIKKVKKYTMDISTDLV